MSKKRRSLNAIQGWLHTKSGQTFLNLAYSWGASIVILGALFKLTHIAGADLMLFIGMGTEVLVFFISGFDVPWEDDDEETTEAAPVEVNAPNEPVAAVAPTVIGGGVVGGGTIIIGNANGGNVTPAATEVINMQTDNVAPEVVSGEAVPVDAAALAASISSVPVPKFSGMTPEMEEATQAYVEQLNELTDILKQVAEQSARLTRDSEEMETMNRTLTGINRFYEMQLRSVGQQSATIDDVNSQTKRLAEQLEELNGVYARMVEALKMKVG